MQIAAAGPTGTLWFYWAPYGSSTWNSVEVGGPGAIAVPVPAMVLGPLGTAEIAVISEYSHLWLYREGLFGEWNAEEVSTQGGMELRPWITRSATGTEITTNVAGYVYAYTDGSQTWTLELPSANRAYYGSPITRDGSGSEVAANAYTGELDQFTNSDGSSAWGTTEVAGPGALYSGAFTSWPAIVRYPGHGVGQFGGTEIAAMAEP